MGQEHGRGLASCCGPGLSWGYRVTVIPSPGWWRRRTASKYTSETANRPQAITGWSPGTSFPPSVGLKIGLHTTGRLACPRAGALWMRVRGDAQDGSHALFVISSQKCHPFFLPYSIHWNWILRSSPHCSRGDTGVWLPGERDLWEPS